MLTTAVCPLKATNAPSTGTPIPTPKTFAPPSPTPSSDSPAPPPTQPVTDGPCTTNSPASPSTPRHTHPSWHDPEGLMTLLKWLCPQFRMLLVISSCCGPGRWCRPRVAWPRPLVRGRPGWPRRLCYLRGGRPCTRPGCFGGPALVPDLTVGYDGRRHAGRIRMEGPKPYGFGPSTCSSGDRI